MADWWHNRPWRMIQTNLREIDMRDIRADRWNLLECRSPAAFRGRGVMTAGMFDAAGVRVATMVHEGQAVTRD